MKKIFVNPTVQVLGVEMESHILGGSLISDKVATTSTDPAQKQDSETQTDGLARPMGTDISAYEMK